VGPPARALGERPAGGGGPQEVDGYLEGRRSSTQRTGRQAGAGTVSAAASARRARRRSSTAVPGGQGLPGLSTSWPPGGPAAPSSTDGRPRSGSLLEGARSPRRGLHSRGIRFRVAGRGSSGSFHGLPSASAVRVKATVAPCGPAVINRSTELTLLSVARLIAWACDRLATRPRAPDCDRPDAGLRARAWDRTVRTPDPASPRRSPGHLVEFDSDHPRHPLGLAGVVERDEGLGQVVGQSGLLCTYWIVQLTFSPAQGVRVDTSGSR